MSDEVSPRPSKGHNKLVSFSPVVELGHILQALLILGTVGWYVFTDYSAINQQLAVHTADIKLLQQRLDIDEAARTQDRADARAFAAEMRTYLDKISQQIADLRTIVAGSSIGDHPRH